ncbi:MAG TPA: hypothetical protein VGP47_00565 [Parachlamydiaceae bacterium]|nr:hypothetical protein [Parachlamydiaceae bacterium]
MITGERNYIGNTQQVPYSNTFNTNNIRSKEAAKPQNNKLIRLNSSVNEQFSKKRQKLNDDNDFLAIVSQMLDDDYNLKMSEEAAREKHEIEMIGELVSTVDYKNDLEKADFKTRALFYQNKGKYAKALVEWKKLSELPDGCKAFNKMGIIYLSGCKGVEKNIDTALRCFKKGAEKGDNSAEFNTALTFDNIRYEANSSEEREKYRVKACNLYNKIAKKKIDKLQPSSHLNRIAASFNLIYLNHLDKNGTFAPKNLEDAKHEYSHLYLKKPNDCRIPLARAFVEFLINEKNNTCFYKKIDRWLKESAGHGNSAAKEILTFKDLPDFKKKMISQLNAPQRGYMQYSLSTSNKL